MKNKKTAGFKMKKSAAKMFGMAALAGQRMMRSPNSTPPTQTYQGYELSNPMMGGAFDPSQLSEAQKAQQEALRTQMRQYKFNLMGGMGDYSDNAAASLQKAYASKDPRMKAILEGRRKKYGSNLTNPKTGGTNTYDEMIAQKNKPFNPRAGTQGLVANLTPEQIQEMAYSAAPMAKKSGFTMKRGGKPSKSEFFKGKK